MTNLSARKFKYFEFFTAKNSQFWDRNKNWHFQAFQEFVVFWTKNGPLKHCDAIQERQERSAKQKYFHFCTDYSHEDDEEFMTIIVSANCIITNKIYQFSKYFLNNQMAEWGLKPLPSPQFLAWWQKTWFPCLLLTPTHWIIIKRW